MEDHREKSRYLIDKFLRERPADHATAYFYKVDDGGAGRRSPPVARSATSWRGSTANCASSSGAGAGAPGGPLGLPQIHNRYLARIAPWNNAPDGHVSSWDRLFYEFPQKEPMRFSGY